MHPSLSAQHNVAVVRHGSATGRLLSQAVASLLSNRTSTIPMSTNSKKRTAGTMTAAGAICMVIGAVTLGVASVDGGTSGWLGIAAGGLMMTAGLLMRRTHEA